MKPAVPDGHYSLLEPPNGGLLFTRTHRQRSRGAAPLILFGLVCCLVGGYAWFRPIQDRPGFGFFLIAGIGLALAAIFVLGCWVEVEIDPVGRRLARWLCWFGSRRVLSELSFDQVKTVRVVKVVNEFIDTASIQVVAHNGKVWAALPGYLPVYRGQIVRRRILQTLSATNAGAENRFDGD